MGGDLATLLCNHKTTRRIKSFVNVEGDLTKSDVFISQRAVHAAEAGSFPKWFEDFKESTVLDEWERQYPECRRYYASLAFAREDAFLANAVELVRRNTSHPSPHGSEIGELYRGLRIPRCFCFGTHSLSPEAVEYLRSNNLHHKAFQGSFHWVMTAQPAQFYSFLREFLVSYTGC
jgi:pimeloyl-ACP methyl ester carboxylesterase